MVKRKLKPTLHWSEYATTTVVDNSDMGIGGRQLSITFKRKIKVLVSAMVRREYANNPRLLEECLPIMATRRGLTKTGLDNTEIDVDILISKWENWLFDGEVNWKEKESIVLDDAKTYVYNRARSYIGNAKSEFQKTNIRNRFSEFNDSRIKESIIIKEVTNKLLEKYLQAAPYKFKPKPDGLLKSNQRKFRKDEHIYMYYRIGDCSGGAQKDRQDQIATLPIKYPGVDFICVWDGLEVVDELVENLNAKYSIELAQNGRGCLYITRWSQIDESIVSAIFDRQ